MTELKKLEIISKSLIFCNQVLPKFWRPQGPGTFPFGDDGGGETSAIAAIGEEMGSRVNFRPFRRRKAV